MITKGKFITFEGIDGSGKSSQIEFLANLIRETGKNVVVTREPGGTPLGEELRNLILNKSMSIETEVLLILASRKEHIDNLIIPALERGDWVISDRFTDSTIAYQCGGRYLNLEKMHKLLDLTIGNFEPDITFLFDLSVSVAQSRISNNRQLDRFEKEHLEFHNRVRDSYNTIFESINMLNILNKTKRYMYKINSEESINNIQSNLSLFISSFLK